MLYEPSTYLKQKQSQHYFEIKKENLRLLKI
jgi:hypothetical protein